MQKVIISDYDYQYFSASIIVNLSDKPFWFALFNGYFYAHRFDRYNIIDKNLEIRDDYYKQLSLSNIITPSQGSTDYRVLNSKSIAFALHSSFSWEPSEASYKENFSGSDSNAIYAGNEINPNSPEIYLDTEKRKKFTTSFFNSLSDISKLELIRNFLPFYTYENNNVALNLSYNLLESGKTGIKTGQFIL